MCTLLSRDFVPFCKTRVHMTNLARSDIWWQVYHYLLDQDDHFPCLSKFGQVMILVSWKMYLQGRIRFRNNLFILRSKFFFRLVKILRNHERTFRWLLSPKYGLNVPKKIQKTTFISFISPKKLTIQLNLDQNILRSLWEKIFFLKDMYLWQMFKFHEIYSKLNQNVLNIL